MYLKFDDNIYIICHNCFILCKKMITTNKTACLMPRSWLLCPCSGGHCPLRVSGGIQMYYALRRGKHMMHFRQPHWKKLVRGAINGHNKVMHIWNDYTYNFYLCSGRCWQTWSSTRMAGHFWNRLTSNNSPPTRSTSNTPWTSPP